MKYICIYYLALFFWSGDKRVVSLTITLCFVEFYLHFFRFRPIHAWQTIGHLLLLSNINITYIHLNCFCWCSSYYTPWRKKYTFSLNNFVQYLGEKISIWDNCFNKDEDSVDWLLKNIIKSCFLSLTDIDRWVHSLSFFFSHLRIQKLHWTG